MTAGDRRPHSTVASASEAAAAGVATAKAMAGAAQAVAARMVHLLTALAEAVEGVDELGIGCVMNPLDRCYWALPMGLSITHRHSPLMSIRTSEALPL